MTTRTKAIFALLIATTVAAFLLLRSRNEIQPQVDTKQTLRISINSWIGWAPLFLAQDKGIFEKDGVKVELSRIEDTGARKSTMISGRVDGYATSVDNFQLDAAGGIPGHIVMLFDESHGADGIVTKKTIHTIQDLKGKQVAFQAGLPSHFLLLTVLKEG